eukprot:2605166-Lingulodinium_polyedra.AAC.1
MAEGGPLRDHHTHGSVPMLALLCRDVLTRMECIFTLPSFSLAQIPPYTSEGFQSREEVPQAV